MPFSSTTLNRCTNASAALNCSPRKYGPSLCFTRSSWGIETPEYLELSPDLYNGAGLQTFKDGFATIVRVFPEERIPLVHEFVRECIDDENGTVELDHLCTSWRLGRVGNEFKDDQGFCNFERLGRRIGRVGP